MDVKKEAAAVAVGVPTAAQLEQINALGTTLVVVTHERELVNRFTKRVIAINEGKVISDGMDGYYLYEE